MSSVQTFRCHKSFKLRLETEHFKEEAFYRPDVAVDQAAAFHTRRHARLFIWRYESNRWADPYSLGPIKNFGAIEVTPHSCKRDHTLARPAYKRRSGGASARLREASTPNRKPRPIRCANCDQSCAAFSPKTCVSVWSNSSSQIEKC